MAGGGRGRGALGCAREGVTSASTSAPSGKTHGKSEGATSPMLTGGAWPSRLSRRLAMVDASSPVQRSSEAAEQRAEEGGSGNRRMRHIHFRHDRRHRATGLKK